MKTVVGNCSTWGRRDSYLRRGWTLD